MYRGTTPTLIFNLSKNSDLDFDDLTEIWITLKLKTYSKTWEMTECVLDNEEKTITITLTQEDTLKMPSTEHMKAQIRFLMNDGTALATNIVDVNINDILKEGVIT